MKKPWKTPPNPVHTAHLQLDPASTDATQFGTGGGARSRTTGSSRRYRRLPLSWGIAVPAQRTIMRDARLLRTLSHLG